MKEETNGKPEEKAKSIDAKLDWEGSYFELTQMIHKSLDMADFKKNIDLLECFLAPYLDKTYADDKSNAIQNLLEEAKQFKSTGISNNEVANLEWDLLRATYSALNKLAFRIKISPQPEIPMKKVG